MLDRYLKNLENGNVEECILKSLKCTEWGKYGYWHRPVGCLARLAHLCSREALPRAAFALAETWMRGLLV